MSGAKWSAFGAAWGFLGVAFGAFGAHGLEGRLTERGLEIYQTAAQYHMYHALALVALGLWLDRRPSAQGQAAAWAFTIGILVFSGSLYALAISEVRALGMVTPLGGLAFLTGWLLFGMSLLKHRPPAS